jgi:hypothetical protein
MSDRTPALAQTLPFAVLLASACAPAYYPSAVHVPMLDRAGDMAVQGSLGFHGLQADAAHATSDNTFVRGTLHSTAGGTERSYYHMASLGGGVFFGGGPDVQTDPLKVPERRMGVRGAFSAEVGGGLANGETTVRFASGSSSTFRNSGMFLRAAVQGEAGIDMQYLALAVAVRGVYYQLQRDAPDSHGLYTGQGVFVEPVGVVRLGPANFHAVGELGLWGPLYVRGDFGLPLPLIFVLGLGARL